MHACKAVGTVLVWIVRVRTRCARRSIPTRGTHTVALLRRKVEEHRVRGVPGTVCGCSTRCLAHRTHLLVPQGSVTRSASVSRVVFNWARVAVSALVVGKTIARASPRRIRDSLEGAVRRRTRDAGVVDGGKTRGARGAPTCQIVVRWADRAVRPRPPERTFAPTSCVGVTTEGPGVGRAVLQRAKLVTEGIGALIIARRTEVLAVY